MRASLAVVVVLALIVLNGAVFIVNEHEQAFIMQFGEAVGEPITDPGLHFKIPIVQKVNVFEKRFLEWDGDVNEVPTKDKRFIVVDNFARWRITDPIRYFERLKDEQGAQTRLDDILDGETRNAIANHNLVEVVRTSNRVPEGDESSGEVADTLSVIETGREKIRLEILTNAQSRTGDLGIEILDVQFKRINYVQEVQEKVYDRMIAERRRIADRFRSEGEGEASRILGEMDRELKRIQSEAFRTAEEIRGKADAEATSIYAAAYDQSADSRRFYGLIKTLETYELTVDQETWLVLSTEGELYKMLTGDG